MARPAMEGFRREKGKMTGITCSEMQAELTAMGSEPAESFANPHNFADDA
jgi:hypothetical protein